MSTQVATAELPRVNRPPSWSPRLVSAELMKLRKRRGLVVTVLLLTVAPMIVAYAVLLGQGGPAGGMKNFTGSMTVLPLLSVVAAILVGATLGTGDTSAGVFRDLVVTGRPRLALFAARMPAGLALLLPIVLAAFAITATASIVFAGSLEVSDSHAVIDYRAPGASLLLQSAGWLALVTAVSFALALGVSSLQGSAGPSIGILLGSWLVAMPVLMNTASLGSLRGTIAMAALDRLAPAALIEGTPVVPMSIAAAVVVVIAWTAVPLALGAWRTCKQDA